MRYSQFMLNTVKESPADAEIVSHKLMLRTGMIKKVAAGIYSYLPFGLRSIRKVEQIIREEMNRAGAQELLMPTVNPAELWQESGRWAQYGKELLRIKDRKETEFCLGPTHEEVVTDIVRREVKSYRQLPLNLYQIQTKFRDEIRPRFGLMRGREFIMKDAYSFDLNDEGAEQAYRLMYQAYRRIFARCGLKFRAVEADSGAIGGSYSHEFMVLAESGEDAIVSCDSCEYAANVEKAELKAGGQAPPPQQDLAKVATPGQKTIAEVAAFLQLPATKTVKALVVETDAGDACMVLLRGDRELNEIKLCNLLSCNEIIFPTDERVTALTGSPVGFLGPFGAKLPVLADHEVREMSDFVCGANEVDLHLTGVNHGRDLQLERFADLRQAEAGDPCPRCQGKLQVWRGIEVGHVFKLGTKYSAAMNATVLDEQGQERLLVMGCYGIGVGRTVAASIEQNHDDNGIIWPMPIAPFQVLVTLVNPRDAEVVAAGEELYRQLLERGVEVLFDDRDERPGSKFKDADLIGIPLRITVGSRGLQEGQFELQERHSGERTMLPMSGTADSLVSMIETALA